MAVGKYSISFSAIAVLAALLVFTGFTRYSQVIVGFRSPVASAAFVGSALELELQERGAIKTSDPSAGFPPSVQLYDIGELHASISEESGWVFLCIRSFQSRGCSGAAFSEQVRPFIEGIHKALQLRLKTSVQVYYRK